MSRFDRPVPCRALVEPLEDRWLFAAGPVVLDLAVVYTAAARTSVGGTDAILQRIRRAVADTNLVFANSMVDGAVRLLSATEVWYAESGSLATDLARAQSPTDGYMDDVRGLQNAAGADLVHLMVADGDDGGLAYQIEDLTRSFPDYGYAVTQASLAQPEQIFAHETMHNLGAGHPDFDTRARPIPYAYGLEFTSGAQRVSDLMGYANRLPILSNPNVFWRGQRMGAAVGSPEAAALGHAADNARVVREFLPTVAANRPTVAADTSAPLAGLLQAWVDPTGRTLTFEVKLADDAAVNVDTLDGNDLRVAGPDGFNQPAAFAGVNVYSNGAQRLARYTVDIGGRPSDPSLYAATLNPGQIADAAGNFAAGGTLGLGADVTRFADRAGTKLHTALELGSVDNTRRRLPDALSEVDSSNNYRFTLSSSTTVTAALTGLSGDAQLLLVRDAGNDGQVNAGDLLAGSTNAGTAAEQVTMTLPAGTYDLWVTPVNGAQTPYALTLQAGAPAVTLPPPVVSPPVSPPPVPPPPVVPPAPPPPASVGGTISGFVWRDNNGNGTRDAGDAGLPGWKVYADLDNNNRYDAAIDRIATTDVAGYYALQKLPNRTYVVRPLGQSGYRQTSSAGSHTVAITSPTQVSTQRNFGYTNRALVTGSVWLDPNRNRVRDHGEVGLGGWQVLLDRNNNGRADAGEQSAWTDAAGNFAFRDALPGTYVIRTITKAGYAATTTNGSGLTLGSGQTVGGRTFGFRRL